MDQVQRAQLRQSEIKSKLSELLDTATETRAESHETDVKRLTLELRSAETDVQAALTLAGTGPDPDLEHGGESDASSREIDRLITRSSIVDFALEADRGEHVDGAADELRKELMGGDHVGYMPLEMLLPDAQQPDLERRADAVTNIATAIQANQQNIAGRVFNRSAVEYLGISTPTVPIGTVAYPRISSGTTGDARVDGAELDGSAAVLTTVSGAPVRVTGSYTYGSETLARVRGFEEALRADLRGVLSEKRDALAVNGQAAVTDESPAVAGILGTLVDPTAATAQAAYGDYVALYDDRVDGKYAIGPDEVRVLVNKTTFAHAYKLPIGGAASGILLRDLLPVTRFRVSAAMPAVSGGLNSVITYATGLGRRGFLMPVWQGIQLVVDPYTLAKKGQRILTAIMLTDFVAADLGAYSQASIKTTA